MLEHGWLVMWLVTDKERRGSGADIAHVNRGDDQIDSMLKLGSVN